MDKNLILNILKSGSSSSLEDAQSIYELSAQYPYSQVLQVLAAAISKQFDEPSQQTKLQHAAVFVSDRSVLKEVMLGTLKQEIELKLEVAKDVIAKSHHAPEVIEGDLADIILEDLKKLSSLKSNFEMMFADQTTVTLPVEKEAEVHAEVRQTGKSKRERIIELAKSLNMEKHSPDAPVIKRKKKENPTDALIEEIKTTKEELSPENEKQKEQIEIIDHFIKTQPSIGRVQEKGVPLADFNSVKSGEFPENIVSETLVEILIKQGKKDKAIEVLKKLIWKYPQKKAFFASQIEELKK